jgi:hypothetical protein
MLVALTESKLMLAKWKNGERLARALGVEIPKGHGFRRRYVTVRRIVQILERPTGDPLRAAR